MRRLGITLEDDLYKKMKIQIIKENKTTKDYVTELIKKDLERKEQEENE